MSAAGRSVVASAPALGAGDREFESPRPDHVLTAVPAAPAPHRCPSTRTSVMPHPVIHEEPPTVKSDVETLNPTRVKLTVEVPFEELSREPRRRVQEDRQPGHDPRLPQGQGARRGSSTSASAAAPCWRRRSTRPSRASTARPSRATTSRSWASPRSTSPSSRTAQHLRFTAEVDVRPEFDLPDYDGLEVDRRRRRGHRRRRRRAARRAARAVRHPHRCRPRRRRRRLRLHRPRRPPSTGEPVDDLTAKGLSYEVGEGSLLEGLDEAVTGLAAGESADVRHHAGRRRPRRPGGDGHRRRSSRSRSASCPSSTTTSPRPPASSTPSTSCAATSAPGSSG